MEFRIQKTDTGLFEIIRTQPVVVGSFPDKAMARKVMSFLVEDAMENMEAEPPALPAPEETSPAPEPTPEPANVQPVDWTEAELEAAFGALAAGQKVKDVADQHGKSWTVLRGKWAAEKKRRMDAPVESSAPPAPVVKLPTVTGDNAPPIVKVTQAITELNDQPECRLCGRQFEQSPDRLDLCAGCSHD